MNANHPTKDPKLWQQQTEPSAPQAQGYDAWLQTEIAQGVADLDADRTKSITEVRKEFGLE